MASRETSFYRYAAMVKNLRGVIYSSLSAEQLPSAISSLLKRFRYRNVGVPPALRARYGAAIPARKTLLDLSYPVAGLRGVVGVLAGLGLDECAAEAYVLASAYVSPVIVLGRSSLRDLEPLVAAVVRAREALNERSWKLHARIADYTVLDMYEWATDNGLEVVKALAEGRDPSELLSARRERVARDVKRYWRVAGEEGEAFVAYLNLPEMLSRHAEGRAAARRLLELMGDDLACCLAVVSAIVAELEGA